MDKGQVWDRCRSGVGRGGAGTRLVQGRCGTGVGQVWESYSQVWDRYETCVNRYGADVGRCGSGMGHACGQMWAREAKIGRQYHLWGCLSVLT